MTIVSSFVSRLIGWARAAAKAIARAFTNIVGEWTWKRPPWIESANRGSREILARIRREPRQSLVIAASVIVVAGAAWLGWRWYDALPRPVEIAFTVEAPQRTCYECEPPGSPNPLIVRFGDSVAPLAGVSRPSRPIAWTPRSARHYALSVVDDHGRSDGRELRVETGG